MTPAKIKAVLDDHVLLDKTALAIRNLRNQKPDVWSFELARAAISAIREHVLAEAEKDE